MKHFGYTASARGITIPIYVRAAVGGQCLSQNGLALAYADPSRRDNEGIVSEAYCQNPDALKYASQRLQNSPEFHEYLADKRWERKQCTVS